MYSDDEAAALYDVRNPWGPSEGFYLALVMGATSVLDVGCGTGNSCTGREGADTPGGCAGSIRTARC